MLENISKMYFKLHKYATCLKLHRFIYNCKFHVELNATKAMPSANVHFNFLFSAV